MSKKIFFTAEILKEIEEERNKWPDHLVNITDQIPADLKSYAQKHGVTEVWASKHFRLRIIRHTEVIYRISVHRMTVDVDNDTWKGNISWDEMNELKRQCGRGSINAVERFPPDDELINAGNYRHLWIGDLENLSLVWSKRKGLSPVYDDFPKSVLDNPMWIN